jgi:hypothetical protein
MKKGTLLLLFCLGIFAHTYSQTKQESIKELFHLMKDDSTSTKMMEGMMPAFMGQKMNQEMDSTAKAKAQEKMKVIMESVKKMITLIKDDKMKLYDKYFTQAEINDMIAFYKSPTGRKYVSTSPEITKEIMMKVMKEYVPEMQKALKERSKSPENK